MNDLLIIQFAKWPQLGQVKTRLAKSLGDDQALKIHIELMYTVFENLRASHQGSMELWLSKDGFSEGTISDESGNGINPNTHDIQKHLSELLAFNGINYKIQQGNSLGDKMSYAFERSLKSYQKVIIVGSDCPNVSTDTLSQASESLNQHDIVIQPAEDGGYVLIGVKRFQKSLLQGVEWGMGKVLRQTLANIKKENYSYSLLDESWDVDELEDYNRWKGL